MPRSMTGFARTEEQASWGTLSCEIRSVNHRYLEPNFRIPDAFRSLENILRPALKNRISRGKIEIVFSLSFEEDADETLALNSVLTDQIVALSESIATKLKNPATVNPVDVLRWPGIIKKRSVDTETLEKHAAGLFEQALESLIANREREGRELSAVIQQRADDIRAHVEAVRERMPALLANQENKLRERVSALQVDVDEERFAQELVYHCQRADVAEELDRLEAHLKETNLVLKEDKPIGRRLDFLMQELNREANTLSSKSLAIETTQHAVDLKVLIEQMREQIQNLE